MNTTAIASRAGALHEWRRYWPLAAAAALGHAVSVLHLYSLGPFMQPLQQEFGWSRSQISIGITITGVTGAMLSVPVGLLVDRVGPRVVGLIGVPMMTSAFALLSFANGSITNWVLLWLLVALGNLGLQATVLTSAVASRFEMSRGLAFAVTLSGGSVAAIVLPVLASWLIDVYGWRGAFLGTSAIWAAVAFPFMFIFFRGAQDQRRTIAQAPTTRTVVGVSVQEGLRSASFYKLLLASGLFTFTSVGIVVHLVPILTGKGADSFTAAGIAGLVGIFSIIGRLGAGFLLDRVTPHLVGAGVFCLALLATILLYVNSGNPFGQATAAALLGFTVGAEVDVIAYLASRHFGLKNYGVLFGMIISALTLGVAFGPLAAGAVFDRYGSYQHFLAAALGAMAVSSSALASLPQPPFDASS